MLTVVLCLGIGLGIETTDHAGGPNAELAAWVRRWAESTMVERLQADFESTTESGIIRRGTWALQLVPSFAQYISVQVERSDRIVEEALVKGPLAEEHQASWDAAGGIGRSFRRSAGVIEGSGTIEPKPPMLLGFMSLPSCSSFFFIEDRPIPEYMKTVSVTAQALSDSRVAVFFEHAEPYGSLMVCVFQRERPQPLVE